MSSSKAKGLNISGEHNRYKSCWAEWGRLFVWYGDNW